MIFFPAPAAVVPPSGPTLAPGEPAAAPGPPALGRTAAPRGLQSRGAPAPEDLHPALWRAVQLGRSAGSAGSPHGAVVASGYAELDAQLPGGGWPAGLLTELLLPHAGVGELRLLAPALAALQGQQRSLMWFDPPAAPCAWALSALGIDLRQLVLIRSRQASFGRVQGPARSRLPAADILWALEHALKSGHLGAAVAWLPSRLPADALRRLQLAAQAHDGPVFLLRDAQERSRPSAAPLRLLLASAGPDRLRVALLKRRGPPQAEPVTLSLAPVLSAPALERARRLAMPAQAGVLQGLRQPQPG